MPKAARLAGSVPTTGRADRRGLGRGQALGRKSGASAPTGERRHRRCADDAYGFGIVDAAAALDVGAHGAVSAPNLAGDASDLPSSPRVIPVGTAVTEGLRLELDQDWFAFDVPATAGARITLTQPAFGGGSRAAEMDPVIELYGPGGALVASADATLVGEPETIAVTVAPGRHLLKVANYAASTSPADYGLRVDLGPAGGAPGPQAAGPWLTNAAPGPRRSPSPPRRGRRSRSGATCWACRSPTAPCACWTGAPAPP
jgi:hypothetical protein